MSVLIVSVSTCLPLLSYSLSNISVSLWLFLFLFPLSLSVLLNVLGSLMDNCIRARSVIIENGSCALALPKLRQVIPGQLQLPDSFTHVSGQRGCHFSFCSSYPLLSPPPLSVCQTAACQPVACEALLSTPIAVSALCISVLQFKHSDDNKRWSFFSHHAGKYEWRISLYYTMMQCCSGMVCSGGLGFCDIFNTSSERTRWT